MRVLVAVTSAFVLLTGTLALPSCSDDPSGATADAGAGSDGDGTPEAGPLVDAAPDAPAAAVEYRGGTRLRPIVTSGGGAKLFSRFHDTLLGVDCAYETLLDGARHCAPTSPLPGSVYFTDAACTQKVVGWIATCSPTTPDKYAQYMNSTLGCTAPEILELGAASTPATTYEKQGGTCMPYAGSALTYRSVARTVPPSELVTGTVAREPRGKQLFATYIDGTDGSRQPFGIEDGAPHAGPCDATNAGDGALRCTPTKLAFIELLYSDTTCTTDAAYQPGYSSDQCALAPVAILESVPNTCASFYTPKYYEPGPKVTGTIYQGSPGSCSPLAGQSAGSTFFSKGAAIPDTSFAALKHVQSTGTPLAIDSLAVDTGEKVRASSFWDPVHAFACTSSKATDGKTRCASRQADAQSFADAACTQPLATVPRVGAGCAAAVPPSYVSIDEPAANDCGPSTLHLWHVGAKVSPAQVYQQGSGCSASSPNAGVDYYATTGEVPAAELVELTEVTE